MAKEKLRFYLAMDQEAPKNAEKFQQAMSKAYVMGIKPIEYHEDTVLDARDNTVVQTIILLECEERWKGAAKRFFKKADFGYLNQYVDELPVYG